MAINYVPNDPLAVDGLPMRSKSPRPDRPANRAGFKLFRAVPEERYTLGTREFLFWQCRESALSSVDAWEVLDGPLSRWSQNRQRLDLKQNNGSDLNAYYDRRSLSFFADTTGSKTTFSGASTDVVAHEAGHALLDVIRPDLWGTMYTETNAFHEAFGDCFALVVALEDRVTREYLIDNEPTLWGENAVEATAEDLSDGVRRKLGAAHPAAAPRHAFNFFNWQLPDSLPHNGKPNELTAEVHSFARVFSGCFYDLIGTLWNEQSSWTHTALLNVARKAGQLLIGGAKQAIETPRFFQSVGQAMLKEDETLFGGANADAIRTAFAYHNILLSSTAFLSPTVSLPGAAPTITRSSASISNTMRRAVMERIAALPGARTTLSALDFAGERVASLVHQREVDLSALDKRLQDVHSMAAEAVLIGRTATSAAVLGAMPDQGATAYETLSFVRTLLGQNMIDFEPVRRGAVSDGSPKATHEVKTVRGKKVLVRQRFTCGPDCRHGIS